LKICASGFFTDVIVNFAGRTDVSSTQGLALGVTTLDGLRTQSVGELSPLWVVECPTFQREGDHRIAVLVTWNGDMVIFCGGELLSRVVSTGVPTTSELFGILELGPHIMWV